VIELRRSATGAPEYRELEISDSLAQRQWLPLTDREQRRMVGSRRLIFFK